MKFFERVVEMHPDAPRPFAVGNCQAGYQTLMVAMLRPDLFGPVLMPGSPISYWQGVHGKNPMRYAGGLAGGSWLTALTSDLGAGKFDGANLIANFDNLNPGNTLFGKQYDVYKAVDTEGPRFLGFEKWWGDFIQLNGEEIQYLVDKHFIGDKLVRNEIATSDGRLFDIRNVTSPIICFTSLGDNISPPQQTLGWILDLYESVDDIRAQGKTIIYCVDPKVGHLAIFVSPKVGGAGARGADADDGRHRRPAPGALRARGDAEGRRASPAPTSSPAASCRKFEARTLDDIRALRPQQRGGRPRLRRGRARVGDRPRQLPHLPAAVRQGDRQRAARRGDPGGESGPGPVHRLRRHEPADEAGRRGGGEGARQPPPGRRGQPVPEDAGAGGGRDHRRLERLPRLARQDARSRSSSRIYGSPVVQAAFGVGEGVFEPRKPPAKTPEERAALEATLAAYRADVGKGGLDEAKIRALLYVFDADRAIDERSRLRDPQGRAGSGRALARRHEADHARAGLRPAPRPRPCGAGAGGDGPSEDDRRELVDGGDGDRGRRGQADAGDGAEDQGDRGPARRGSPCGQRVGEVPQPAPKAEPARKRAAVGRVTGRHRSGTEKSR